MSYIDTVAHDPSAPAGHLPGFAREERCRKDGEMHGLRLPW
jgi:hypothetical protein